jgi:hypothetical protein
VEELRALKKEKGKKKKGKNAGATNVSGKEINEDIKIEE